MALQTTEPSVEQHSTDGLIKRKIRLFNTLSGQKEAFEPIVPGHIGMYVCGPTVYYDVHIGNCRTFTSFDVIHRYLRYIGYKVRYVRNITDVGHLLDDGEDRMSKGARLAQLEPMEVAQKYTVGFHEMMRIFNTLPPSIEPRATGHIPEQIEMVQAILENGYGYEANGSVYFDVEKLVKDKPGLYGSLSGRVVDDLLNETRTLKNQGEKRNPQDFAIWMKAADDHLLRWNSPWSVGFPGWHLECSAMSVKYLGQTFDIHGGGNDLKFPHHENEIAQNQGACGCSPARHWLHTNMMLLNGKKMSKSDGNTITPTQLFTGDSPFITKAYSAMTLRYFMLQAHYRSTLDITDSGLQSAEKGYKKLMEMARLVRKVPIEFAKAATDTAIDAEILNLVEEAHEGMDDDFNTAIALSKLMELGSFAHKMTNKQLDSSEISPAGLNALKDIFSDFMPEVLGLTDDTSPADGESDSESTVDGLMNLILDLRLQARTNKDWATSDRIRDALAALNIAVKDGKDGATWSK